MRARTPILSLLTLAALGLTTSASAAPAHTGAGSTTAAHVTSASSTGVITPAELRPARPPQQGAPRPRGAAINYPSGCYSPVSFQSAANSLWVSAELGYTGSIYGMLRARATTIGPWEMYTLCYTPPTPTYGGYWTIQSTANGDWVQSQLNEDSFHWGMLTASEPNLGQWDQYNLYCTTGGTLVIQNRSTQDYVSAELGYVESSYGMLRARATTIGPWEQYYTSIPQQVGC